MTRHNAYQLKIVIRRTFNVLRGQVILVKPITEVLIGYINKLAEWLGRRKSIVYGIITTLFGLHIELCVSIVYGNFATCVVLYAILYVTYVIKRLRFLKYNFFLKQISDD